MIDGVFGAGLVVLVVVVLAIALTIQKLLYVSTPNEVLIFSGTERRSAERALGYRFVRGGRSLRRPFIEKVDRMDLNMITVVVSVEHAFTKGGVPLTIQGVANVKLPGEEPRLSNAVERFLGRSREDIHHVAKETLEGNLRGVLASLTPEEVNEDKMRFAHMLVEEADHDMSRMGLVLDTLKIQNVSDSVNYLSAIGRIRGAALNQTQAIAEAEARADAAVQQASNWAASEVAKIDADLEIARQETAKRIADAKSRRQAMINEARGAVVAATAQVKPKSRSSELERCRRSEDWRPTSFSLRSPSSVPPKSERAGRPPRRWSGGAPRRRACESWSKPIGQGAWRLATCSHCRTFCPCWGRFPERRTSSRSTR